MYFFRSYCSLLNCKQLCFGIATIATVTIVADIISEHRRGAGMGYFALVMNLAMVIGPFLGLTIIQYSSFNMLFIITSFFSLFAVISGFIPSLPKKQDEP